MEAEEQKVPAPTETADPPMVQPERKNLFTLIQEWPLSRKIATGVVLFVSILLFGFLIFQARVADQQLLYANLSTNDASLVANSLKA